MKRLKIYLVLAALLLVINSNAQSFYAKIYNGIGYTSDQPQGSYFYPLQFSGTTLLKDNITPVGNGAYWGAGVGFFACKYLGEDISMEYMTGYENGEIYIDPDFGEQGAIQFNGKVSVITLMPDLLISSNNEKRFFGYIRLGPTFHYYSSEGNFYNVTDVSSSQQSYKGRGGLLGYSFALGIEYKLKKYIHFFLEGSTKTNPFQGFDSPAGFHSNLFASAAGVKFCIGK